MRRSHLVLASLLLAPLTACDLNSNVLRCSTPEDCPAEMRCDAELGVCMWSAPTDEDAGLPPPRLLTESLPPALNGAPYEVTLEAADGTPPLRWSLVEPPASLSWLALEEATGVLQGTPPEALGEPQPFRVRVVDAEERTAERELQLRVDACNSGDRIQCTHSEGAACFIGESVCTEGRFGACGGGVASSQVSLCGENCQECGATADGCVEGACSCGDAPACASGDAPACCGSSCVDLASDTTHCGDCGTSCLTTVPANTVPTCAGGDCAYPCKSGYTACNAPACTDTKTDWMNCGTCGTTCFTKATAPPNTVVPEDESTICAAGACTISCKTGYGNCNNNLPSDGCEINILSDPDHCNGCTNQPCPERPNATRTCVGGNCSFACNPHFASCNGLTPDGCEVNLQTNIQHCGNCDTPCIARPNATMECSGGSCRIASCKPGWADCDGILTNGCEADIYNNTSRCGSCTNQCDPDETCSSGKCCFDCGGVSCCSPKRCVFDSGEGELVCK